MGMCGLDLKIPQSNAQRLSILVLWHCNLTCKLPRLLPGIQVVRMIMEKVGNNSFTLTIGNGEQSKLRRLKNCVPHRSVLEHVLFNICFSDLPNAVSRKYAYGDHLAALQADGDWQVVKGVLSKDMVSVGEYLQTGKLSSAPQRLCRQS